MGINTYEAIQEEVLEIDVIALLQAIKKAWWLIALSTLLGLGISFIYTTKLTKPMYAASSMVYMRGTSNNPSTSLQDLQVITELTNDYEVIFKSRPIMEHVVEDLDLQISYKQLASRVQISNPTDTRILKVVIQDQDPAMAMDIVNQVVKYGMESANEIDQKEPYLIERAIEDHDQVSPNTKMNLLIGSMIGFVFMSGLVVLRFLLHDRIITSEDVERLLGVPVLSEVMEHKSCRYNKIRRRIWKPFKNK